MRFTHALTIPANTSKAAPVRETENVTFGILAQVQIQIPPGPAGLAGVRVYRWSHQIVPASPDLWLVGDDDIFTLPERVELHEAPLELLCEGYNEDDLYEHTIILHFDVLPEDPAGPKAQIGILEQLRQLFGL